MQHASTSSSSKPATTLECSWPHGNSSVPTSWGFLPWPFAFSPSLLITCVILKKITKKKNVLKLPSLSFILSYTHTHTQTGMFKIDFHFTWNKDPNFYDALWGNACCGHHLFLQPHFTHEPYSLPSCHSDLFFGFLNYPCTTLPQARPPDELLLLEFPGTCSISGQGHHLSCTTAPSRHWRPPIWTVLCFPMPKLLPIMCLTLSCLFSFYKLASQSLSLKCLDFDMHS